jgi:hypothetical protein
MDCGKIIKGKKTPTYTLENLVEKREEQASKAIKMGVKWT